MLSKWIKRALCIVLSLSFVFCSAFATDGYDYVAFAKSNNAQNQDKIDKINQHIAESQKKIDALKKEEKDTKKHIALLDKQISQQQDKIDALQKKSNAIKSDISEVERNIAKAKAEIESIQREIDKKQKAFEQTYSLYSQRLRAMYVSGHVSNLEVLLSSSDTSSILVRSQMINSVAKQDSKMLDALIEQMETIEKDKAELEKRNIKLADAKNELVQDKAELDKDLKEIKSEKASLDKKIGEANSMMRKLASQENEYMESIDADKAEKAKLEREIQNSINNNGSHGGGYLPGGGKLAYPTSYRRISAGYPNYSSGRYHGGVDFPCPTGTPVHASADGTVILVKRLNRSYGYHFIIDHGNGLATLCAHNSEILVSVGQKVTKGQVVAKSGSTGNSTGPHVHFEVRVNGNRVNPNHYLGN